MENINLETNCIRCSNSLLIERADGSFFLRNNGIAFEKDLNKSGKIKCKKCKCENTVPIKLSSKIV